MGVGGGGGAGNGSMGLTQRLAYNDVFWGICCPFGLFRDYWGIFTCLSQFSRGQTVNRNQAR